MPSGINEHHVQTVAWPPLLRSLPHIHISAFGSSHVIRIFKSVCEVLANGCACGHWLAHTVNGMKRTTTMSAQAGSDADFMLTLFADEWAAESATVAYCCQYSPR